MENYEQILAFVKSLRTYFISKYNAGYVIGALYTNISTITYFPFTPECLKQQKLKIAIVFNHINNRFEIWLAAQNKQIQKKYWQMFVDTNYNKYTIPVSCNNGFAIVEHVLANGFVINNPNQLTTQIEQNALLFINDMVQVFE